MLSGVRWGHLQASLLQSISLVKASWGLGPCPDQNLLRGALSPSQEDGQLGSERGLAKAPSQ